MMLSKDEICSNTGRALHSYVEFPSLRVAHSIREDKDTQMHAVKSFGQYFSLLLIKVAVVGIFSFWH